MAPRTPAHPSRKFANPIIFLHWLMALLLLALVICMEIHDHWPRSSPWHSTLKSWHYQMGLLVFVLVFVRLLMRGLLGPAPEVVPSLPLWQRWLANAAQIAMYGLMIALPLLGWLVLSAKGQAVIPFLGGLELPPLMNEDLEMSKRLKSWHEVGAELGFWLVGLHTLAALYHHYWRRDNTLTLMLPKDHKGLHPTL